MEKYKEVIAENPNVEFIHVSLDNDEDAAETWAAKESFPWLTILPDKQERSGLMAYKTTNSVPEYHLIDAEGETIAKGSDASFSKAKELGKEADGDED